MTSSGVSHLLPAHVVCGVCGTRWTVRYQEGSSPPFPRECNNHECDAAWLDLSMFMDEFDADRFASVREATDVPHGIFSDSPLPPQAEGEES